MFTDTLELDLGTVEPSLAGPKRPQDRVPLRKREGDVPRSRSTADLEKIGTLAGAARRKRGDRGERGARARAGADRDDGDGAGQPQRACRSTHQRRRRSTLRHGAVVIAAITSCTNTSNPSVMLAAGLLARNAVAKGLSDEAVGEDVARAGLEGRAPTTSTRPACTAYLDKLGFNLVGYGCTTCIGNSGPLPEPIAKAIEDGKLFVAGVLSGNRNFEGRVNPLTRFNYLASPPLVVAYALAGRMDIDLDARAARHRQRRPGVPARHLADAAGSGGRGPAQREGGVLQARSTPTSSRATSSGRRSRCRRARPTRGTRIRPT